jgi:hypothetical protein
MKILNIFLEFYEYKLSIIFFFFLNLVKDMQLRHITQNKVILIHL